MDTSDKRLGAVLSQGSEHPMLYINRKLSMQETKYSTIEKECLVIKWAVLTLRYYLLGRAFTLCLDHTPQAGWLPGLSQALGVCGGGGQSRRRRMARGAHLWEILANECSLFQ